MIGLDYLMAGYLHLAQFQPKCELKKAPEITVSGTGSTFNLDATKDIAQLDTFKPNLNSSPYEKGAETHIEGLTHGSIGLSGQYEFANETYPALNVGCLYVSKVNIEIHLDPTVFIAKEYPKGSCHYNAIMQHEKKHVEVDKQIVNKYANILVKAVNNTLKTIGFAQGPFNTSELPSVQKRVNDIVTNVIQQYSENMNNERKQRQSQVDTLQEYQRVDALCPKTGH